jgi:hypothetical protein
VSVILENFEVSNVDRAEEYMNMLSAEDDEVREHQKSSFGDAKSSIFEWMIAQQAQEQQYIRKISSYSRHAANRSATVPNSQVTHTHSSSSTTPSSSAAPLKTSSSTSMTSHPSESMKSPSSPVSNIAKLSRSHSSLDHKAPGTWAPGFADRIRMMSHNALKSSWYPYVLYGTIIFSSLTLAFTPPKHQVSFFLLHI